MTAQEKLIAIYEQAEKRLFTIIQKKGVFSSAAVYERSLLQQVQKELRRLKADSAKTVNELVIESYQNSLNELIEDLKNIGAPIDMDISPAQLSMSKLNTRQIEMIARNVTGDFNKAVDIIGRRTKDIIRTVTLEATAQKLSTGQTVRQMQKSLTEIFKAQNVMSVPYKNGANMPIKKYAEMTARSTTAEAQNKAQTTQGRDWGYDLVEMTSHSPTCPICAMYQGRVYAITKEAADGKYKAPDGTPLTFPYLYSTAFAKGYETIHPNCRHRIAIFPARAYTKEKLQEFSQKSTAPFEDTRTDQERKAYAEMQAVKRRRNANYKQYERINAALPNDAPKSFAGFVRMKQANSQRYQELIQDYRYIMRESKKSAETLEKSAESGIIEEKSIAKANAILVHKNDPLSRYAKNIKPIDGFDDFTCHATPDYFEIDTVGNGNPKDYVQYHAKEYAEIIKNSQSFHGGNIRIISCQSGAKENGIAKQLADELGCVVMAPTENVFVDSDGRTFITNNEVLAEMWFMASEDEKSNFKETGEWKIFKPKEA